MRCHDSGKETGPLAASLTVRCLWCGRELERKTPPPGEPERLPEHNMPVAAICSECEGARREIGMDTCRRCGGNGLNPDQYEPEQKT